MKSVIICGLLLINLTCICIAAPPKTFEEFKQMSTSERYELDSDVSNPQHAILYCWWRRQHMGEKAWQSWVQSELIDTHDFIALRSFFRKYLEVKKAFVQEQSQERSNLINDTAESRVDRDSEVQRANREINAIAADYDQAVAQVSMLAMSPQAQALNQKANDLLQTWDQRYPYGTGREWSVKTAYLSAFGQQRQEVLDAISKLPKMTPTELQDEVDALPNFFPTERGGTAPRRE